MKKLNKLENNIEQIGEGKGRGDRAVDISHRCLWHLQGCWLLSIRFDRMLTIVNEPIISNKIPYVKVLPYNIIYIT